MSDAHRVPESLKHSRTDYDPDTTATLVVSGETCHKPGVIIEELKRKLADNENIFILTPHITVAGRTTEHVRYPFMDIESSGIVPYRTPELLTTVEGDYLLSLEDDPKLTVTPDGRARLLLRDGCDDIYLDDSDALADANVLRARPNEDNTRWTIHDAAGNVVDSYSDRADWEEQYQPIREYADPIGPDVWERLRIFYEESGGLSAVDSSFSVPAGDRAVRLEESMSTFYERLTVTRKGETIPLTEFHSCWAAWVSLSEFDLQSSLLLAKRFIKGTATIQSIETTDGKHDVLADRTWRYPLEVPEEPQY